MDRFGHYIKVFLNEFLFALRRHFKRETQPKKADVKKLLLLEVWVVWIISSSKSAKSLLFSVFSPFSCLVVPLRSVKACISVNAELLKSIEIHVLNRSVLEITLEKSTSRFNFHFYTPCTKYTTQNPVFKKQTLENVSICLAKAKKNSRMPAFL